MKRQYLAHADNGHDYIEFTFWSGYRANSKGNKQDAKAEYHHKHGYGIKIISTERIPGNTDYCC